MYYNYARRQRRRRIVIGMGSLAVVCLAGGWWTVHAIWGKKVPTAQAADKPARVDIAGLKPPVGAGDKQAALPDKSKDAARPRPAFQLPPDLAKTGSPDSTSGASRAGDTEKRSGFTLAADEQPLQGAGPRDSPTGTPTSAPAVKPAPSSPAPRTDAIDAAWSRYESGDKLAARQELNSLLGRETSETNCKRIRELLSTVADETIFSPARLPNDPLVEEYAIQKGDRLVNLAPKFKLPYGALMRINDIKDPGRIRENQRIKVLHGPFNARIHKSDFRIDIYLQDVYVRSYRVAVGAAPGTPDGTWKVKNKLIKPTFFPPASYPDKKVIPAGDPKNPLGDRWIGLEGLDGAAAGQEGFGIHGTCEPDSIGRAVSLGCVRMLNDEVAVLYDLMQPGESKVTVLP